jgi:hypothetical protein
MSDSNILNIRFFEKLDKILYYESIKLIPFFFITN